MLTYLPELLSISVVAILMAISPGADFVMITRNSLFHGRLSGLYSALGIGLAIWVHVAYSIAGLALLIAQSVLLFSIIKYLGAAYLIYIGYRTFTARGTPELDGDSPAGDAELSRGQAFRLGFVTNVLNPKTTLFFLSIFTQLVNPDTPISIQLLYGAIISLAHLFWFSALSLFFSHPALVRQFNSYKRAIERAVGGVLMAFGIKVATMNQT
nr:LysE family transporter [Parahaliea mediterranea]